MTNAVAELKGQPLGANPFGNLDQSANLPAPSGGNAMMTAEMQRQVAEIQAQFIMALHRPRNPLVAVDKMLVEAQRPSLAEVAIYSFSRGGTEITGLSIRALEMIARNWGNIKYGFRCLDRKPGASMMQAYAYDLESNVPVERVFEVKHVRDTKQGRKPITDERDIYELEANQAQRRVRACIEALIPGDVTDACEDAFKRTLEAKADTSAEGIKRLLEAFKPFKVNQAMIEARIQRNITSITAAQMVGLKTVYNSLKDGMSSVESWFDVSLADKPADSGASAPDGAAAALKDKISAAKGKGKDGNAENKSVPSEAKKGEDAKPNPDLDEETQKAIAAIADALTEAETVGGIDDVWNDNAERLEKIKGADASAYANLDAIYLKRREALEIAGKTQKTLV